MVQFSVWYVCYAATSKLGRGANRKASKCTFLETRSLSSPAPLSVSLYSFHALYTMRDPYVCPFLSSVWSFHSGTLSAFT
jgi:hypothetical protein